MHATHAQFVHCLAMQQVETSKHNMVRSIMPNKQIQKSQASDDYRFRRLDHIGVVDAEQDTEFLQACFIETGDLSVLSDCSDTRSIVVGRTGSGKTALLTRLCSNEDRAIVIRPESLALSYISNSTILQFFDQLEVKLDIFFRLLWRHVFTVELIKHHFNIRKESDKDTFIQRFLGMFSNDKERKSLEYLQKWGSHFWKETEYRIKDVTSTLEDSLQSSVRAGIPNIQFDVSANKSLSVEEKSEAVARAQHVINSVQIRQLSEIIDLIDQVLDDRQKQYFIVIDRLDEEWIEDRLRYRLIRALIETIRDFQRVRNAKIVIALRLDLVERVFQLTRDPGFQEEKYVSLNLQIKWSRSSLIKLLDARIDHLIKRQFTKKTVTHKDLLPPTVRKVPAMEFIFDRTMMRPRDVIMFFNFCIENAVDKPRITVSTILEAEGKYSKNRLRSLTDEWISDYPNLSYFVKILKARRPTFLYTDILQEDIEQLCLDFCIQFSDRSRSGPLSDMAKHVVNCSVDIDEFRTFLSQVFYRIGLIGLKLEAFETVQWSATGASSVSKTEISEHSKISVHPMYWRALGIRVK